ncbi:cytochrome b [Alphaproteobacteria bacterium]|nr:cytochrome b [Alphaproteobacteria bacterium]MDB3974190.1 cytochrome b [Alphaproteobacteria bacterium]
MPILNNNQKYGLISILFHWSMAIIILITFLLGKNLQDNFENYYFILQLHNSFGLSIFILAIFRIIWRFISIKPGAPSNKIIFMKIASLTHIVFYILFFIIPITGYFLTNLQGDIVKLFGTHLPSIFERNSEFKYFIHDIHYYLGNILLFMLALHILGALYHHIILKDNTLRRISFMNLKK